MIPDGIQVPPEVIALLELREGFRNVAYLDSLGKPTAGMGHLLSLSERALYAIGATIPDDVLQGWAESDSTAAYIAGKSQARQIGLPDNQALVNALACVSFQVGNFWYIKFPKTWALLKNHEWELAAMAIQDSKWYK